MEQQIMDLVAKACTESRYFSELAPVLTTKLQETDDAYVQPFRTQTLT